MKKKILFIYGQLNGGGAERVLLDILHNFDYQKYEVDLCQIIGGGTLIKEVPPSVNIIELWNDYTLTYKLALRLSKLFNCNTLFKQKLKSKLTKKYDMEISFLEGFPLKIHSMIDSKAKKITWVHCDLYRFHYTYNQFRKGEELAAYNKMDKIVCVSQDTLTAFNQRFPQCSSSKVVIYNPIDKNKILTLSNKILLPPNKKFTIITVGRLTEPKKIDRVIRIAKKCKSENISVKFQIIGDGELREQLKQLAKKEQVDDYVDFLGFMQNPFPYIKNANMMFCCSGYEGFCLVICEAMCLGIPVVSTKTSGPIEILDNNQYGLLCDHDDESMFQAVKAMIQNTDIREKYKIKGVERIKLFSVDSIIKQIEML